MSLYPKLDDPFFLSSDEDVELDDYSLGRAELHYGDRSYEGLGNHQLNEFPAGPRVEFESSKRQRKSYKPPKGRVNSSTVSLDDFEQKFLNIKDHPAAHWDKTPKRRGTVDHSFWKEFVQWFERTSKWRVAFLGCILGLFCAVLYSEFQLGSTSKDVLLPCIPPKNEEPCIPESELKPALSLAQSIRKHVHSRSALYDCGDESVSRNMTLQDLRASLPEALREHSSGSVVMKRAFYLILHNPRWGIRWTDSNGDNITWAHYPGGTDLLESFHSQASVWCKMTFLVHGIWTRIKLALLILLVILVLVAVVHWYIRRREGEVRAMYIMVDRIVEVLRRHYETSQRKKDLLPYLAIIHVRDMLIPPSERKQKAQLWEKSCDWIATHESRVRVETRRIAGEDFQVWRWIQVDPPATEEPSVTSSRKSNWQGRAFEDYPPSVETRVAPPAGNPSPFIRLKNMFEPIKRMDDDQALELENSVLDRCIPHGGVVHIFVDRKSTFGCVYLKMESIKSALGAYKALHGGWYKGKLVTAKYIPEAKYHKWFPHAANAKKHLLPTS